MSENQPRLLTQDERAVLDRLLSVDFDGVERLREEVMGLQVAGGCDCGCPTIHFRRGNNGLHVVVQATTAAQDQTVLLFVGDDGSLESLELAWVTDAPPPVFPAPDELTVQPSARA